MNFSGEVIRPVGELEPFLMPYGRTYRRGDALYMDWTYAGFSFCFEGTRATMTLRSVLTGQPCPFLQVTVDGDEEHPLVVEVDKEYLTIPLTGGLRYGEHRVTVRRRSEIGIGQTGLVSLSSDGRLLAPPPLPQRRIEVIGDSLACGHGNRAGDPHAPFHTRDEDGCTTFATLAAASLGADCTVVAKSGVGLVANYNKSRRYTMPVAYPYTALWDGYEEWWDFEQHRYDVTVIALGTNDWVAGVAPQEVACAAEAFLSSLRRSHPHTWLLWCYGMVETSMLGVFQGAVEARRAQGDERVDFLPFLPTTDPALLGSGHPLLPVHREYARLLEARIRLLTGW